MHVSFGAPPGSDGDREAGLAVMFKSRKINVLLRGFKGSKISIVPFSIDTSGDWLPKRGGKKLGRAPSAVQAPRDAHSRPPKRYMSDYRIAADQFLYVGLTGEEHFLDADQFGARSFRRRFQN